VSLPGLAAQGLGPRGPYRITVRDGALGERVASMWAAAGHDHSTELVLARGTAGCALPGTAARPVGLAELRTAVLRQQLTWTSDERLALELTDRRAARLRGAEDMLFPVTRTPEGEIAAWADVYLDRAAGLAQLEDLVTATPFRGQGHGGTLLATGLAPAAAAGIPQLFLVADGADWPREWYVRCGFAEIGRSHSLLVG
jgi:hypothetical protein